MLHKGRNPRQFEGGGGGDRPLSLAVHRTPPTRLVLAAAPVAVAAGVFVSPLSRFLLESANVIHDYLVGVTREKASYKLSKEGKQQKE